MNPRQRKGCVSAVVVVFLLAVMAALSAVLYWRWGSEAKGGAARAVRITVAPGAALAEVGKDLERQDLIRSPLIFGWLGRGMSLQPGVYDLSPAETPRGLLKRLAEGDVATVKVTFPEGFTLEKIARRLKDRGIIASEETFLTLVAQNGSTLKASFPPPRNLEGYLFPDTYPFPVGATEKEVAQQMLSLFDRLVAKGKASDIKQSRRSLAQIITVASLIEREAETDADRPKIAGVIYNRLARNQRLEIDATVQYARKQHKSRLLFRDLDIDSPYNTYRHSGLPPGAISCAS